MVEPLATVGAVEDFIQSKLLASAAVGEVWGWGGAGPSELSAQAEPKGEA